MSGSCESCGEHVVDCECDWCKLIFKQYFCSTCGYNFNKCESFYKSDSAYYCPKCRPKSEGEQLYDTF